MMNADGLNDVGPPPAGVEVPCERCGRSRESVARDFDGVLRCACCRSDEFEGWPEP